MQRADPKVALIGFGPWGRNIAKGLHRLTTLRQICDSDATARRLAAEQYPGLGVVGDVEAILTNPDINAVVLATPATTHFDLSRQALTAGKDVWVEKPLAMAQSDGERLIEQAARKGRVLMVGHILRYHPAVEAIQRLIEDGALGDIEYLYSNRVNMGRIRTEENILWSFAPHDISLMLALTGEMPDACSCVGAGYFNKKVADVTVSHFEFPGGVHAHIFVSWLHPFKEQRLVVVGSKGMVVFEETASEKLLLFPHQVAWNGTVPAVVKAAAEAIPFETAEPLLRECEHFLGCLKTRRAPRTDGQEGLRVLRVLERLQQSLEANGTRLRLSPDHER
jgi:UDP-2-acetamido-3-amino-2,3-dideoxy-glucuronate N-acetyltransferase